MSSQNVSNTLRLAKKGWLFLGIAPTASSLDQLESLTTIQKKAYPFFQVWLPYRQTQIPNTHELFQHTESWFIFMVLPNLKWLNKVAMMD